MKATTLETPQNVITLTVEPRPSPVRHDAAFRFKIVPFQNRGGSASWRVSGIKRDGTRIRENFLDEDKATKRRIALEAEYHTRQESEYGLRSTKLNDTQLRLAESCFARVDRDEDLLVALDYWFQHGKQSSKIESPRLDEAAEKFFDWLLTSKLRDRSRSNLRSRINIFRNSVPNHRVADITPAVIETYLDKRDVSQVTKTRDWEAISRFFSWCIQRPREWATVNPCGKVEVEASDDKAPPAILTVEECKNLLAAAEKTKRGCLIPYVAVCLFGGLRPMEAQRLTWDKVNLQDGEIRVEAQSSKRKEPRVVTIGKTLAAWLKAYEERPFHPENMRRCFDQIKEAAGYTGRANKAMDGLRPWPADVLRHTAISHYFRNCGSYGLTAEWAGNSEKVIRDHYQARVSTDDTKRFYSIMPRKGGRK